MYYYGPSAGGQSAVNALAKRLTLNPINDYTQAKKGDPRVMLVPVVYSIYYQTDANGNIKYKDTYNNKGKLTSHTPIPLSTSNGGDPMKIVGFIAFYLQDVAKDSHGNYYDGTDWRGYGRFLYNFNIGSGIVTPNADYYYGVMATGLVQ
jgi:hypothetical protein